jgi:chromosome segregation ATPase
MSIFPNPSPQGAVPPSPPPPPQGAPAYNPPPQYVVAAPSSGGGWKIGILSGIVLALLGGVVYLYMQLDQTRKDLVKTNDALQARIDKLEEVSSVTTRSNRKTVDELREQLNRARRQASALAGEAKQEALKKVDETRVQLETAQEQAKQQLKSDISQVKEQTDSANTKISQVGNDVTAVKTDLTSTKSELEKTVAELKRATGELDGHSVMIATNGKELAALRALGERSYVEFTVRKSKQAQKVGDVSILLKNADPKKNRYTIELTADDRTTEKKDRGVNEPLQFMTSKAKQPYELIVNDVKKDTIVGYLSVPKVQNVRN